MKKMKDYAKEFVKKASNKDLLRVYHADKDEREHPERHTRYVSKRTFFGKTITKAAREEISRRKEKGIIKQNAGITKKRSDPFQDLFR